jgi:chromatin remodeling complex protein RSC6
MSSNLSSDNTKMSATVKTTKKSTKTETAPVVVAAPAPVAPVATKATKTSKAAKAEVSAPVVVAPVVAAPVVVAPVATPSVASPTTDEDVGAVLLKSITDLHDQLTALKTAFQLASASLKTIDKQAARVVKKADRRKRRSKTEVVEGAEPKPCIFTKPVRISEELCSFLGKPKDTEVSRSSVTKALMAYARANSLMDKQTIKADSSLRKLLTLNEGDALTILNLQKYLRRHYVKTTPVAA